MTDELRGKLIQAQQQFNRTGQRQKVNFDGLTVQVGSIGHQLYRVMDGQTQVFETAFLSDLLQWVVSPIWA